MNAPSNPEKAPPKRLEHIKTDHVKGAHPHVRCPLQVLAEALYGIQLIAE